MSVNNNIYSRSYQKHLFKFIITNTYYESILNLSKTRNVHDDILKKKSHLLRKYRRNPHNLFVDWKKEYLCQLILSKVIVQNVKLLKWALKLVHSEKNSIRYHYEKSHSREPNWDEVSSFILFYTSKRPQFDSSFA